MRAQKYIISLLVLLTITLKAQESEKIVILNANNTFGNAKKHADYWRLIGDVAFNHNNATMYCDSAHHYVNEYLIKAFGNIKITQGDSITVTGNQLIYFASKNIVDIKGSVMLTDKYMSLETDQLFYNLVTNIASYPKFGKIIDDEKVIESKKGEYLSNLHKFIFKDSVTIVAMDYNIMTHNMHYNTNSEIAFFFGPSYIISRNKTIYCENGWYNTKTNISQFQNNAYITTEDYLLEGDSLFYNKELKYGKAMKNVVVIDTAEQITIFGGLAEYFEEEKLVEITDKPLLEITLEQDTLYVNADKFISNQKDGVKKMLAYKNVSIFKTDLQGKCDSLSYSISDSILEMYNKPIIWIDELQITSDSLQFLIQHGRIKRMFLKPNPIIISKVDSLDYNQIQGKRMTGYFSKNKIRRMNIDGNGQSIFIIIDEKTDEKIGYNATNSSDLTLYFEENKLTEINYEIKPNSKTTPYKDVKEKDRYLQEFNWRKSEQPNSRNNISNE